MHMKCRVCRCYVSEFKENCSVCGCIVSTEDSLKKNKKETAGKSRVKVYVVCAGVILLLLYIWCVIDCGEWVDCFAKLF